MPQHSASAPVLLTSEERDALLEMTKLDTENRTLAQRARIILACAEPDATNTNISRDLGIARQIVATWRMRFVADRLEGLMNRMRPDYVAPNIIGEEVADRIAAKTSEPPPPGLKRWSTRSMAQEIGVSHTIVASVWKARGIRPHAIDDPDGGTDAANANRPGGIVSELLARPAERKRAKREERFRGATQ